MDDFNRRSYDSGAGAGSGVMLFVAGALVGAAAALIFAPATGADARAFLGRRGRELADDVAAHGKRLWDEHGDRVASAVKRGYEAADNVAGAVKRGYENATGTMGEAANGTAESSRSM